MIDKPHKVKVTICIPAYNQERIIKETIESALMQCYEDKEILLIDDCSTDNTLWIAKNYGIRVMLNRTNLGFAGNMNEFIKYAEGEYLVFLCGDDKFTHPLVISDMVAIFDACPFVAVIDRDYYQYMDGYPGAVVAVREEDPLLSSINPSGMGFRWNTMTQFGKEIYVETPLMVKEILHNWDYKKLSYDTIAVRIHKHNQACSKAYYRGSSAENWLKLFNNRKVLWDFKSNYICIKNRVGQIGLIREILLNIQLEKRILLSPKFWFFALFALAIPGKLLREISDFYRHRIGRLATKIIPRSQGPIILNLGAGHMRCNDTINVDIMPGPEIDQVVDLSKFPWPWEDNSVDGILASHVLEHIEDQKSFLLECHRILKKGAILTLILPHSSSVIANGCLGHYRTYSFNTISDYLCRDFYMFGEAKFKEISNCLTWWNSDIWYIKLLNNIISPLIRLHPQIFENIWCYWVGGAKEFGWKGRKI